GRDIMVIARDNWQQVSAINFLSFTEGDDFDAKVRNLLEVIDTDRDYVSQHTQLEQRAVEWHENGRRAGFLLREDALIEAEAWFASGSGKKPPPTELQIAYIQASRRATTVRQRTTVGALTFGLIVALTLALLAFLLFQQSETNLSLANERGTEAAQQAATSERRADEARSLALAIGAEDAIEVGQLDVAVALAV